MTVKELINELLECPMDYEIRLSIAGVIKGNVSEDRLIYVADPQTICVGDAIGDTEKAVWIEAEFKKLPEPKNIEDEGITL